MEVFKSVRCVIIKYFVIKEGAKAPFLYLLHTYIVTSKPKRISVAAGLVHIIVSLLIESLLCACNTCNTVVKTRIYAYGFS